MDLKSEDLNQFSPAAAPAAEFNKNLIPHVHFETILKGRAFPGKMPFLTKIIKTSPPNHKFASNHDCERI